MAEKKFTRIPLDIEDSRIDALKTQLRNGTSRPISATQAIEMAISSFQADAGAVKLNEPERREIESRTGATTPIRNSKDILRAFERTQGGADAVSLELDPGLAELMRSQGREMGYGLAEFTKIVLEESYMNQFVSTIELKPVYFTQTEWKNLTELLACERIPGGKALLAAIATRLAKRDAVPTEVPTAAV